MLAASFQSVSDYNGDGIYVIDQNNIDHHPLTQHVDISVKVPTLTASPNGVEKA